MLVFSFVLFLIYWLCVGKNPSIKVGDLDEQLKWVLKSLICRHGSQSTALFRKYLSKMAFKRLREIKTMFMKYSAKLSPEKRKEWKEKFSNKGLFELKEQTAQVRRSQTLPYIL